MKPKELTIEELAKRVDETCTLAAEAIMRAEVHNERAAEIAQSC
jgi:hypothetical protein